MKILPAEKIREADEYTIKHEPIAEIDLMERAATECFYWFIAKFRPEKNVLVFCGSGNNGGDGFVLSRLLHQKGFTVKAVLVADPDRLSSSCNVNYHRYRELPGSEVIVLKKKEDGFPKIAGDCVIIDALFGSGLTRPVEGHHAGIISKINQSGATIVSIDLPSGLYCDQTVDRKSKAAIVKSDYTLTFSPPKLALFFQENDIYLGEWILLDIGIMEEFIEAAEVKNYFLEKDDVRSILKRRNKFDHKGTFGHALVISGSYGKMGASVLATQAALRGGAGLVTSRIPSAGINIIQTAVPEAMVSIDPSDHHLSEVPDLSSYSAIGIGPGIGMEKQTAAMVKLLIQESPLPLLFDADAINILAGNRTWLGFIRPGSIFTPHPKEFERLAGKSHDQFERNRLQREFSVRFQCYTVLKGAYTSITTPSGICYFNSTGNPGMATGGSGDVLTGIITGLRAQGYDALEACILGVYIHGLSGDIALKEKGYEALIAGDIINNLGNAFHSLYGKL